MPPRIRVFIASSLDGFIAGPDDELDWLSAPSGTEDTFTPFMAHIGAMLMGRRTYDVVQGFDGEWAYGDTPVLVATSRPLEPARPSVRAVSGTIEQMCEQARAAAGDKDVYLDGGAMIRAALDADLVDDLTVTIIPMILGAGIPLFAGVADRHPLDLISTRPIGGGLVQLVYHPAAAA